MKSLIITYQKLSKIAICLLTFGVMIGCSEDDEVLLDDGVLRVLKESFNGTEFSSEMGDVTPEVEIHLVFSHSLETAAVSEAISLNSGSGSVPLDFSFSNENSEVSIIPQQPLDYDTSYTLNITAGEYGTSGESLQEDLSIPFQTAPYIPPNVKLSANAEQLKESAESLTVTATLDKEGDSDVNIELNFGGDAILDEDYSASATTLTIPAGELSASFDVISIPDQINDDNETITIGVGEIENATDNDQTSVNILITEALPPLSIKGVLALTWDGSGTNDGKAVHVVANEDIADLSIYGLGIANNGGGTDGLEYSFPQMSVLAGDDILVARTPEALTAYFGSCADEFEYILESNGSVSQNGDDAIELFKGETVIETYGDADVDGTGMEWEYSGSWAYKIGRTWTYGGVDCTIGASTNSESGCPYPICKEALQLQGVMALLWDGSGTNGGKAIHLRANKDIEDLSIYSVGIANNGGGTDGIEYTFPQISVSEGEDILLAREPGTIAAYFGDCINNFDYVLESNGSVSQNGDDAIELFKGEAVIETYGDVDVDGTGEFWEYSGSWAFNLNGDWTVGGLDCAAGSTSTQNSSCVYPLCD